MGLFSTARCANCGQQVSTLLGINKMEGDGNYLCPDCQYQLPDILSEEVLHYDIGTYYAFVNYVNYSRSQLNPVFRCTATYEKMFVDTNNYLLCFADGILSYKITAKSLIFDMRCIQSYSWEWTEKDEIYFTFSCSNPPLQYKRVYITYENEETVNFINFRNLLDKMLKPYAKNNTLNDSDDYIEFLKEELAREMAANPQAAGLNGGNGAYDAYAAPRQPVRLVCSGCGSTLAPGESFCRYCGTKAPGQ